MNNKSSENREKLSDLDRAIALGVAGAVGGITVQLCSFPLGRSVSPIEDGEMVFKMVNSKILNLIERRRGH